MDERLPAPPVRPTLDRAVMASDLEALSMVLGRVLISRSPGPLASLAKTLGVDLTRATWDVISRALDLPDDELALLIEAAATELGAWRGVRDPVRDPSPALALAMDHLAKVMLA